MKLFLRLTRSCHSLLQSMQLSLFTLPSSPLSHKRPLVFRLIQAIPTPGEYHKDNGRNKHRNQPSARPHARLSPRLRTAPRRDSRRHRLRLRLPALHPRPRGSPLRSRCRPGLRRLPRYWLRQRHRRPLALPRRPRHRLARRGRHHHPLQLLRYGQQHPSRRRKAATGRHRPRNLQPLT